MQTQKHIGTALVGTRYRRFLYCFAVFLAVTLLTNTFPVRTHSETIINADTALILAIDVSGSVDETRYQLQMEGVARAIEDPAVVDTVVSGPRGGILLSIVFWADRSEMVLPWQLIRNIDDAKNVASQIRNLPQHSGEFTCMSRMLSMVKETVVPGLAAKADRIVLDVSGDGIDNCREATESDRERDVLVAMGVTINGLPIIVKGENETVGAGAYRAPGYGLKGLRLGPGSGQTTLDAWYNDHVIGGTSGFLFNADGFEDFGRAFRQKFVTEISVLN